MSLDDKKARAQKVKEMAEQQRKAALAKRQGLTSAKPKPAQDATTNEQPNPETTDATLDNKQVQA